MSSKKKVTKKAAPAPRKAPAKKPAATADKKDPVPVIVEQLDKKEREELVGMAARIMAKGFVPHHVLRSEFNDKVHTVFSAIAFRQYRVVREVRRPWEEGETAIGFEIADHRFSKSEVKKMPAELGWVLDMAKQVANRYTDFQFASVKCRYTNFVLAALPVAETQTERVFERVNGDVLIPAYCVRAAFKKTLPVVGKTQSLGDYIRFSAVRIPVGNGSGPALTKLKVSDEAVLGKKIMPVVDERAHQGKGLTEHEALPPQTEFTLDFYYPASELPLDQLVPLLQLMGRFTRLSPARSSGYGDFEVIEVNGQPISVAA